MTIGSAGMGASFDIAAGGALLDRTRQARTAALNASSAQPASAARDKEVLKRNACVKARESAPFRNGTHRQLLQGALLGRRRAVGGGRSVDAAYPARRLLWGQALRRLAITAGR